MCGIVGVVGSKNTAQDLVSALKLLEYRGYDSAGIATVDHGALDRRRTEGALANLEARLGTHPIAGRVGIGHTRWATHGLPVERNAHPHSTSRVSVVHNGIIENHRELRVELARHGAIFESETDTEVIVHAIDRELSSGLSPLAAVHAVVGKLRGAFAVAAIFAEHEDLLICTRRGSPLAIGHSAGRTYIGSDAIALAPFTSSITYLEDGDTAMITSAKLDIFDAGWKHVVRPVVTVNVEADVVGKGGYPHYMAKEMAEQPDVIARVLAHYFDLAAGKVRRDVFGGDLAKVRRVLLSACGTANYAGQIARTWIEKYARVPVDLDVASELRYRDGPLEAGTLAMFVSQSGETADTLAALRHCKSNGLRIAAVVNVPTSSIAREADMALPTLAGPEIGVASTKAFTCQLCVLAAFAIALARATGRIDDAQEQELVEGLVGLPGMIADMLKQSDAIADIANDIAPSRSVLFLGRGQHVPLAFEGALKLKEITYLHAEGYAAGELKHGPIALIDANVPVIAIAPDDALFEKMASNMQEVAARGGRIIAISDADAADFGCPVAHALTIPTCSPMATSFVVAVLVQLLAYHTALALGRDVDRPRNLAKSVTVE